MDIDRQRKLEWRRRILPIFGGIALVIFGNIGLVFIRADDATLAIAMFTLAIGYGIFLAAMGVWGIKYRKWVYSVEERLAKLEKDCRQGGG